MIANAAFYRAARHLFRHLCEPTALRKNSLVKHFFVESEPATLDSIARDRIALTRIHGLVRRGAEQCRSMDIAAGREERARRQHTIVLLHALERRPIADVAATLAISCQQCYRERADVAVRIAHYISQQNNAATVQFLPDFDTFRLQMEYTRNGAAYRERQFALERCDDLVRSGSSASQKIEALRIRAIVALGFGSVEHAEGAVTQARGFVANLEEESPQNREVALACIDLLGCDLAYHRADSSQALALAQSAARRLEDQQQHAPSRVVELYAESLYELGAALWNAGRLDEGYAKIVAAEALVRQTPAASAKARARTAVGLWKSRNHLLMSSESWCPLSRRVAGLSSSFEASYAAGLLTEAAEALVALVQCHAFSGADEAALRTARAAAALARQHSNARMRAQISIQVAMALLWSKHWERGISFVETSDSDAYDGYHGQVADYLKAERALRRRALTEAWKLSSETGESRAYPALAVRRQLVAAAAAHQLERAQQARAFMEAAIPAAEEIGSAPILRDAYAVAAAITGDSGFRRSAGELSRLLTA
jgi:hypothetical protein